MPKFVLKRKAAPSSDPPSPPPVPPTPEASPPPTPETALEPAAEGVVVTDAVGRKHLRVKLPPLECSVCHIGAQCPEYKEGYVCAFEKPFAGFGTRDADEVEDAMYEVVSANVYRWRMALLLERTTGGGMADPNTTRLGDTVMSQLHALKNLREQKQSITVTAVGPKAGGILSQLFGRKEETAEIPLNPPQTELVPAEQNVVVVEMTREQRSE